MGDSGRNDVQFEALSSCDPELFSEGLRVSLYNYMNGTGFDLPLHKWFGGMKVPRTTLPPNLYRENSGGIAPRRLAEYLITDLTPHEITSGNPRAIDIPGIPVRSLVEIILIGVEDILDSSIYL